jgi:hypothetical protein
MVVLVGCCQTCHYNTSDVLRSNTTNPVEILSKNYEEKIVTQFSLFKNNNTRYIFCNTKKQDLRKCGPAKDQREGK